MIFEFRVQALHHKTIWVVVVSPLTINIHTMMTIHKRHRSGVTIEEVNNFERVMLLYKEEVNLEDLEKDINISNKIPLS